ncbi:ABC transporter substrate-binding protein [uncultured Dysosmobacter sp.]|uniref:ABC transporter substrate-binding protein n=1 Tax=uncultured Dysosmobacter sp. TaxID=2591384 RepID=UPI00260DEAF9|nr:ABC transporter substrate-binding protein [uncultured Dysosmobacter sp.]
MELRGITWDHERGVNPMIATSDEFHRIHPDVTISWRKRSLKDFGDGEIEKLLDTVDLIAVDHPFMPEALKKHLLLDLKEYIDTSFLEILRGEAIGASFDCYCLQDTIQALPMDVACETAAFNAEFFHSRNWRVPKTVDDIFALKEAIPENKQIGFPFWATDMTCIFMNLTAQQKGRNYFDLQNGIDLKSGAVSASVISRMAAIAQPDSFDMNPIDVYNAMSEEGTIVYSPYGFGYTNYSRCGYHKDLLEYYDAPLINSDAEVSTVLGGVGIAISSRISSEKIPAAVEYLKFVVSPDVQKGIYTLSGGQPATMSAWLDEKNNQMTNNFFKNTLRTHQMAFVRPQLVEWPYFHTAAGEQLQKDIRNRISPETMAENFNRLYKEICIH